MEIIGYFEEYYMGTTYIGRLICDEQPNRPIGYRGKSTFTTDTAIKIGRKKIPAGEKYTTIYYEMQGKLKK